MTETVSSRLMDALRAAGAGEKTLMVISADASPPAQAVVTVMDAARRLGLVRITFAAQTGADCQRLDLDDLSWFFLNPAGKYVRDTLDARLSVRESSSP